MELSAGEGKGVEINTRIVSTIAGDWKKRRRERSCATIQYLHEQLTKHYSEGVLAKVFRRKMCTLVPVT